MVQWLRLCASIAGGAGLIPGRGTEIPNVVQCGKKKKKKLGQPVKACRLKALLPSLQGQDLILTVFQKANKLYHPMRMLAL